MSTFPRVLVRFAAGGHRHGGALGSTGHHKTLGQ